MGLCPRNGPRLPKTASNEGALYFLHFTLLNLQQRISEAAKTNLPTQNQHNLLCLQLENYFISSSKVRILKVYYLLVLIDRLLNYIIFEQVRLHLPRSRHRQGPRPRDGRPGVNLSKLDYCRLFQKAYLIQ